MNSGPIQQLNEQLARQINDEARRDPKSQYAGKCVGIADGRVVVVGTNWDEVIPRLHQIQPDVNRSFCVEAGLDYDTVEEIWTIC